MVNHIGNIVRYESSTDNFNAVIVPIANTNPTLAVSNLSETTSYRAVVQLNSCVQVYSSVAVVTVNDISQGGNITGLSGFCTGTSLNLTLTNFVGTVQRWEFSTNNFSTVSGTITTSATTIATGALTAPRQYRAVVKNGFCNEAYSEVFALTQNASPIANAGSDVTILQGSSTQLTASGGASYEWRILGNAIVIGNSASFFAGPINTTTYRVTVISPEGCTATDDVTVNVDFSGLTISPSGVAQFNNIPVNTLSVKTLSINNVGTLPFTINSAVIENTNPSAIEPLFFSTTGLNLPLTLNASQNQQFNVHFQPTATLFQSATLTLNTSIGVFVVSLSGNGTSVLPAWAINPTSYSFESTAIGTSATATFTIANLGNVPINVGDLISNNTSFSAT